MAEVIAFEPGGYRYIKGVFQYSAGVVALPGFAIEHAVFRVPLPLAEGFAAAEAHMRAVGRPPTSFCACELRSPAPFTEQGFYDFNRHYIQTLERWGIFSNDKNPVARSNVCPAFEPPAVPSMAAFSYTMRADGSAGASFVIAGSAEAKEGSASYRERIVRLGDTSPEALREKMRFVMGEMERRLVALGFTWRDALVTRAYTVQNIGALVADEIVARGAARHGLSWHFCWPPVEGLDYEMDVAAPVRELILGTT